MDIFNLYDELMQKAFVLKTRIDVLVQRHDHANKEETLNLIHERSGLLARCDQLYVNLSKVA